MRRAHCLLDTLKKHPWVSLNPSFVYFCLVEFCADPWQKTFWRPRPVSSSCSRDWVIRYVSGVSSQGLWHEESFEVISNESWSTVVDYSKCHHVLLRYPMHKLTTSVELRYVLNAMEPTLYLHLPSGWLKTHDVKITDQIIGRQNARHETAEHRRIQQNLQFIHA